MSSEKKNQDLDFYREAMSGIRRIKESDRIDPEPPMAKPVTRQQGPDHELVLDELIDLDTLGPVSEFGAEFSWHRPGVQKRILKRLRSGQFSAHDTIDLHHMNEETARMVLLEFIEHARRNDFSCLRVIHGKGLRSKGLPTLKMMTAKVLQQHPLVVCFASCLPADGGTGATNVLLSLRNRS